MEKPKPKAFQEEKIRFLRLLETKQRSKKIMRNKFYANGGIFDRVFAECVRQELILATDVKITDKNGRSGAVVTWLGITDKGIKFLEESAKPKVNRSLFKPAHKPLLVSYKVDPGILSDALARGIPIESLPKKNVKIG